ncbi:hypothetical protein QBC39DRAFT_172511 [Podospora conica]|nr:hypothetical protein QBC39DRAFT_172511 [Schizothecium conicum]
MLQMEVVPVVGRTSGHGLPSPIMTTSPGSRSSSQSDADLQNRPACFPRRYGSASIWFCPRKACGAVLRMGLDSREPVHGSVCNGSPRAWLQRHALSFSSATLFHQSLWHESFSRRPHTFRMSSLEPFQQESARPPRKWHCHGVSGPPAAPVPGSENKSRVGACWSACTRDMKLRLIPPQNSNQQSHPSPPSDSHYPVTDN